MDGSSRRAARVATLVVAAVAALTLAACGGDDPAPSASSGGMGGGMGGGGGDAGEADVTIVATEFSFSPDPVTVPAGSRIELVNDGTVEHDLTIEEANMMVHADPGESGTIELNLDPGNYTIFCSVPGHREAGMEGTLTVE